MNYQVVNFPWKQYPTSNLGNVVSEYTHYKTYRQQTVKLYKYLQTMLQLKTVVYLAVGDAMEEYKESSDAIINDQWRQLFPIYIENASKEFATEIIIITPNINCNPTFLTKTQKKYGWTKVGDKYESSNPDYKITVRIFITPFPCIDTNNNKLIDYLKTKEIISSTIINDLIQTTADITFLEDFNNVFAKYINHIKQNGVIICNYLAVFNNDSVYSTYNNFYFAPILKNIIKNNNSDIITSLLLKWTFNPTITTTSLVLPLSLPCSFSYISEYTHNSYNIIVSKETSGLQIVMSDIKKNKFNTIRELVKHVNTNYYKLQ